MEFGEPKMQEMTPQDWRGMEEKVLNHTVTIQVLGREWLENRNHEQCSGVLVHSEATGHCVATCRHSWKKIDLNNARLHVGNKAGGDVKGTDLLRPYQVWVERIGSGTTNSKRISR